MRDDDNENDNNRLTVKIMKVHLSYWKMDNACINNIYYCERVVEL